MNDDGCKPPYGHSWTDYESTTNPLGGGWYLTMRCEKCGTVFRQIINFDGSLHGGRRYKPSFDYKSLPKLSRTEWRYKWLQALKERDDQA